MKLKCLTQVQQETETFRKIKQDAAERSHSSRTGRPFPAKVESSMIDLVQGQQPKLQERSFFNLVINGKI